MNDTSTSGPALARSETTRGYLPRRTVAAITAAGPLAALALVVWLPVAPVTPLAILLTVAFACVAYLTPVPIGLHTRLNMDDVVLVVAMMHLPAPLVPLCLAAGLVIAQGLERTQAVKVAFNASVQLAAASAAVAGAHALGFAGASLEERALLAFGAAVVHAGGTALLVALVTARLDGVTVLERVNEMGAISLTFAVAAAAYGALTVFGMRATPVALPVAVAVAALFMVRSRIQAGGRSADQRRLVEAAGALYHATDLDQFERIVADAVRDLFGAHGVRLTRSDAPLREGVEVPLPGRPERLELTDLPGDLPVPMDRRDLLTTLSSLVAAALDRLATIEKLGRESERDPLTDAYNRRRFERDLRQRVTIAAPHVLALIDLDGFKALNDAAGHQAGDELLRALVRDLRATFRGDDRVFRLGGDEFAVLLTDVTADVARERFEAFLAWRDEDGGAAGDPHRPRVRLSVGLAAFPDHATDGDALVRRADAALYDVKRRGGDGVAVAGGG